MKTITFNYSGQSFKFVRTGSQDGNGFYVVCVNEGGKLESVFLTVMPYCRLHPPDIHPELKSLFSKYKKAQKGSAAKAVFENQIYEFMERRMK